VPLGKAVVIAEYITDTNGDNLVDDPNDEEAASWCSPSTPASSP
jgi:hypothetical protein